MAKKAGKNQANLALFEAQKSQIENDLKVCQCLWDNTENPIYVWRAISLCFRLTAMADIYLLNKPITPPLSEAAPFPGWVMKYLFEAATGISNLAEKVELSEVLPKEATMQINAALKLVGNRKNAFERAKEHFDLRLDDLAFSCLRESLTEGEAVAAAAEESGIDPRSFRARRANFKKVFAGTEEAGGRGKKP